MEAGSASVVFRSRLGRQVHLSNEGLISNTEVVETSNFQRVAPGALLINTVRGTPVSAGAPYAPRFVLFDELANQPDSFIPQKGIAGVSYLVDAKKPTKARLVLDTNGNGVADAGNQQIGTVQLKFKGREKGKGEKDNDAAILPSLILTSSGDGVTDANSSILNVPVNTG